MCKGYCARVRTLRQHTKFGIELDRTLTCVLSSTLQPHSRTSSRTIDKWPNSAACDRALLPNYTQAGKDISGLGTYVYSVVQERMMQWHTYTCNIEYLNGCLLCCCLNQEEVQVKWERRESNGQEWKHIGLTTHTDHFESETICTATAHGPLQWRSLQGKKNDRSRTKPSSLGCQRSIALQCCIAWYAQMHTTTHADDCLYGTSVCSERKGMDCMSDTHPVCVSWGAFVLVYKQLQQLLLSTPGSNNSERFMVLSQQWTTESTIYINMLYQLYITYIKSI